MPISRTSAPLPWSATDPLVALLAGHSRIRDFLAGLEHLALLSDLSAPRFRPVAAQARRYFAEGFPLQLADEDRSLAPRLRAAFPGCAPLLARLERDHQAIQACLATLLMVLDTFVEGRAPPRALLRVTVASLSGLLVRHLANEEAELFPLIDRLPAGDRAAIALELVERRA